MICHIPFSRRQLLCPTTILCAFVLLLSSLSLYAQNDSTPKRGFQPGGSYALGEIETINTSGGNLMFHLPLVSLPAGRSGNSMGKIGLFYNSKLWDLRPEVMWTGYTGSPNLPIPQTYTRQRLVQSPEGGWRYGLKYELQLFDRMDEFQNAQNTPLQFLPNCGQTIDKATARWKLKMAFPDGSIHEFRPQGFAQGYPPQPGYEGWYKIRPDGWETDCIGGANQNVIGGGKGTTNAMTWYTVDGTFLKLVIQHDTDDGSSVYSTAWKNNFWTLYFPDGSRVSFDSSGSETIYDRNNTFASVWNGIDTSQPGSPNSTFIDDPGHELVLNYNGGGSGIDNVRMKGANNQDLVYQVKWGLGGSINQSYQTEANPLIASGTPHVVQPNENGVIPFSMVTGGVYEIDLPAQAGALKYTFAYNNAGWGQVNSVTLPSGAKADYQYFMNGQGLQKYTFALADSPIRKDLTYGLEYDGSDPNLAANKRIETWTYALDQPFGGGGTSLTSITTGPDGGVTTEYLQSFNKQVYRTIRPDGSVVERIWNENIPYGAVNYAGQLTNAYIATEFTSITNSSGVLSKTAIKDYKYDKNGNVTQVVEYDWIPYAGPYSSLPSGLTPKRVLATDYYLPTPDAASATNDPNVYHVYANANMYAPRLLRATKSSEVRSGLSAATAVTRTEVTYDDATGKGNVIQERSWDSTKNIALTQPLTAGSYIASNYEYNVYGGRTKATDANGNVSKWIYAPLNGLSNLYPTQIIVGENQTDNSTIKRTTNLTYDFNTRLVTQTTDADNNITTQTTYDDLMRPTLVQEAFGTTVERRTVKVYNDAARRVIVRNDKDATGDGKLVSIQHYDQLGRGRLSRNLESPVLADEPDETKGIKVQTRYFSGDYNGTSTANPNGYTVTSNPYRAATSSAATSEPTMGWSRTKSDIAGRVIEAQSYGGTAVPAPFVTSGANTTNKGLVTSFYDAEKVRVTDQAGKQRTSATDGLGRLINVWEAPNAENYLTTYTYDTLDNLTNVNQGGQLRSFAYSSLKRLTSATNPESGTTTYTYDNNGNLLTKTDARPLTTMFSYDGLNRVTTKSYSQYLSGTTNVNYYYDGAPNGKGKFSYNVSYNTEANGTLIYNYDQINSYDQLGRPTIKTQNFLVNQGGYTWKPYVTSATYNLAGAMTSETYPSGRTVNYAYDDAGRTTSFTGYLGDGAFRSYATAMTYLPAGQLVKETFGTTTPLYQNFHYNVRQQLYDVRVGTNGADPLSWDRGALEFLYGSAGWGDSNADNNGNITRSDHWIPDASGNWSSTTYDYYGYDSLNRVASTTEYTNSSSNTNVTLKYSQQFDYDRYGNRTINQANTTTSPDINKKLFSVNTTNNRLGVPGGQTGAMAYDNVGNLISDTYTNPSAGGAMEYDADNHMTAAVNGSHKYRYNADGKRVRRIIASQGEFWMVYGIGGELVAEYNASTSIPAQTSPSKEYGYRNGKLLIVAEGSTPKWLIQDHLGSTRMEIGQGGNIGDVTRHDYLPFGEELTGAMRSGNGYAIGNTKQKFTGHERDTETGLDFMQARYYANVQGRFTSPDNPFADQSEDDPQSWNLYAYAHNNPLAWIDPTGQFAQKKECFDNGACLNPATGQFELPGEPSGGIPLVITVRPDAFTDILAEQLIQEEQMRRRMDQVSKTDFDFSGGGIVRVGIKKGGAKLLPRILKGLRIAKAVNLPAWKTIAIDIKHILSGHTLGGSRVSSLKDLFPSHMSEAQIEKAVREAYRYGEKVSSQGERVMIQGEAAGLKIEMWVNTVTKTIETAYPVF